MKRVSILLLTVLLSFSLLAACGGDKKNEADKNNKPDQNQTTPNQPDNKPNTDTDSDKEPADKIEDGMDNMMDGAREEAAGIWEGIVGFFGSDARPSTVMGEEEAFAEYGLPEDLVEGYHLQSPKDDNTAHEFLIVKIKEGRMAEAEEILEKRKEAIANKWADAGDDMGYAQEPVILKSGNYLMLAVHEDAEELREEFDKLTQAK